MVMLVQVPAHDTLFGPWELPDQSIYFRTEAKTVPSKVSVCRLEPQVLSQENGEDAAQVVHSGRVKVGLGVSRRVPHSRKGRGDEVEHWDPWRGIGDLATSCNP